MCKRKELYVFQRNLQKKYCKYHRNFILVSFCNFFSENCRNCGILQTNFMLMSFCWFFAEKGHILNRESSNLFNCANFCRQITDISQKIQVRWIFADFTRNLQTLRRHVHRIFKYITFLQKAQHSSKMRRKLA